MIIYLDVIFAINIIADFFLLILTKKDLFPEIKNSRIFIGALISSVTYTLWYSLKMLYLEMMTKFLYVLYLFFLPLFIAVIVLVWTFRIRSFSLLLKTIGILGSYVFLMGGFCYLLYIKIDNNISIYHQRFWISIGAMFLFTVIVFRWKKIKRESEKFTDNLYEVEFRRRGKAVCCQGIYDSGNLLVSQVTGKGICVMSLPEAQALLNDEEKELLSVFENKDSFPWEMMAKNMQCGLYPICYSSVGRENAAMPGVIADWIIVRKNGEVLAQHKGMIGISSQTISKKGDFSVLLPADIFME